MRTRPTSPALLLFVFIDMGYLKKYVSNDLKLVKHDNKYVQRQTQFVITDTFKTTEIHCCNARKIQRPHRSKDSTIIRAVIQKQASVSMQPRAIHQALLVAKNVLARVGFEMLRVREHSMVQWLACRQQAKVHRGTIVSLHMAVAIPREKFFLKGIHVTPCHCRWSPVASMRMQHWKVPASHHHSDQHLQQHNLKRQMERVKKNARVKKNERVKKN